MSPLAIVSFLISGAVLGVMAKAVIDCHVLRRRDQAVFKLGYQKGFASALHIDSQIEWELVGTTLQEELPFPSAEVEGN